MKGLGRREPPRLPLPSEGRVMGGRGLPRRDLRVSL